MSLLDGLADPAPCRSGGETLLVRRLGNGPRLLLVHGGPGLDHHVMLPLAIPLSRSLEVWLPDLPGHGRSHPDPIGLPDLTALIERTARWLAELSPPVELLVGHSLGAWLLREIVAAGRVRPRALVLMSSPVAVGNRTGDRVPRSWVGHRKAKLHGRESALAREFLELCAEDTQDPPSPAFVECVSRARLRPPIRYEALQGQLRRSLSGRLRALDPGCPVLVVTGDADPVCPPDEAMRLAAATGGARVHVQQKAGHVPFATEAEPIARAIRDFLEISVERT